jgi:hypothetical protein
MKTAMQEAIELVKKYDNREILFNVMIFNLELLLEKEKQQIIEAINEWCSNDNILTPEQYYNNTYNNENL